MTSSPPPDSIGRHMVRGGVWMVGMRWATRLIGLVSTMILARLLVPEDFGIVAMAMIVVGFLEVFSYLATDLALIQNQDATREHYDAAWTVNILQALLLTAALFLLAEPAAAYFRDDRLVAVIRWLSLRALLQGFQNIGVVAFRKELDFAKEFRFWIYRRLIQFFITVGLALMLRSYWALVAGIVVGQAIGIALSYAMHPYRPRLCFRRMGELWNFSQWMLIFHVGRFLGLKTDQFVIGRLTGATSMGSYFVASEVATMPTHELAIPLGRGLFPAFAKLTRDPPELAKRFLFVLAALAIVFFSLGFGLAAVSEDAVAVILGDQWSDAAPLMEWLAIFGAFGGFAFGTQPLFIAVGKQRLFALLTWLNLVLLVPSMVLAAMSGSLVTIAMVRAFVAIAYAPVLFYYVTRITSVTGRQIVGTLWRPLIAALVMTAAVRLAHPRWIGVHVVSLAWDVAFGGIVFLTTLLVLWRVGGRPDGPERVLVDFARNRLRRKRSGGVAT